MNQDNITVKRKKLPSGEYYYDVYYPSGDEMGAFYLVDNCTLEDKGKSYAFYYHPDVPSGPWHYRALQQLGAIGKELNAQFKTPQERLLENAENITW